MRYAILDAFEKTHYTFCVFYESISLKDINSKVRATIFQVPYAFAEFCARSVNWGRRLYKVRKSVFS